MSTPTTELDGRFSTPDASPISWDDTRRALETAELFWISTVRTDGRPHVTPLVAVWLDEALHFCTGPDEQKAHNLASNPHVVLTTGANDWQDGVDIVVEGRAEPVSEERRLRQLADAWTGKWDGRWNYETGEGGFLQPGHGLVLVYAVAPTKVLVFGKGTFSHTRHRFR